MAIDWSKPIRLVDDHKRKVTYRGPRVGRQHWVDVEGHCAGEIAVFLDDGTFDLSRNGEPRLGQIENVPEIDWKEPVYFLDNDERAHVREWNTETETAEVYSSSGAVSKVAKGRRMTVTVDDSQARLYEYNVDGTPVGHPRPIANMSSEQQQAAARVAIKKAQAQRRREREQAALDELADTNPMFGMF